MKQTKFEIVRAFAFKKNLGNFENFDVSCSAKQGFDEIPDGKVVAGVSKLLIAFCYSEVKEGVRSIAEQIEKDNLSLAAVKNAAGREAEKKDNLGLEFVAEEDPDNEFRA